MKYLIVLISLVSALTTWAQTGASTALAPATEAKKYKAIAGMATLSCELSARTALMTLDRVQWQEAGKCLKDAKVELAETFGAAIRTLKGPTRDALKEYHVLMTGYLDTLQPEAGERESRYAMRLRQPQAQLAQQWTRVEMELATGD